MRVALLTGIMIFLCALSLGGLAQSNQTVGNGANTAPVNFPAGGCTYQWTNNNPSIGLPATGTGNIAPFTAVNTSGSPVTATVTAIPAGKQFAYIANAGSNNVSVIDLSSNAVIKTIQVGVLPFGVAVSPDGTKAYVTNFTSNTVSVISTATNSVTASFFVGLGPEGLAVSPDGKRLYVADIGAGQITAINTADNGILATINVGPEPEAVLVSPDGSKVYVSNSASNYLSVINTTTFNVDATINVQQSPIGLAITPDGKKLYVDNEAANTVSVINTANNSVTKTISVGLGANGIAMSPDGTSVYVSSAGGVGNIYAINTGTDLIKAIIPMNSSPYGLSFSADGSKLYAVSVDINVVSVINTKTNTVSITIPVGSSPYSMGNFVANTSICNGQPILFTITVNPNSVSPVVTTSTVTGNIIGCLGAPGTSPNVGQFTVAGTGLTGDITITPPAGFDISLTAAGGYSPSLVLKQIGGAVISTTVFIRTSASDPVGPVSGDIQLTTPGATTDVVPITGVVNALPTITPVQNLTYINGVTTSPINFTGTADGFDWTNDNTAIGLYTSGSGSIPAFKATNTGNAPITGTIIVTPKSSVTGCAGTPFIFTITVDPSPPSLNVSAATGTILACLGSPSTIPNVQQFTISGNSLSGEVTVTASPGFELSGDGKNFSSPLGIVPNAGSVPGIVIYVRTSASAPKGNVPGNITVSTPGLPDKVIAVSAIVNGLSGINPVNNQTYKDGDVTQLIVFTGNSTNYTWTNSNPAIGLDPNGSGNLPSFTATNPGLAPITATISVTPTPSGYAYIPDYANNVLVVNTTSNLVIASIPVGQLPDGVAVTPDGSRVFVANDASNSVSVIDAAANKVMATIPMGNGTEPFFIAISPDASKAYVANSTANTIAVINTISNQVTTPFPVGANPICIAISPDGSKLYVVNQGDQTVSIVNAITYATITTIPIGADPYAEVISPDGKRLYVTGVNGSNRVYIIDTQSYQIITSLDVGADAQGITITPDGSKVYVANTTTNNVTVINTANNSISSVIPVGGRPYGIDVSPDGSLVYVINSGDNSVSIISTGSNTVTETITSVLIPLAVGNFVSAGAGCSGAPLNFTITVDPGALPVITSAGTLTGLSTIYGTASPSESFKVSASNARDGILVTAPQGFEVSLDNQSFSPVVNTGFSNGAVNNVPVYIRLAATTPVANYTGDIVLSSTGATDVHVNMPLSVVNPAPLTVTAPDVIRPYGVPNPVFIPGYQGFVNGEDQSVLTTLPVLTTIATIASAVGKYPIHVDGGSALNYTIIPVDGTLTIAPAPSQIIIPNAFTPNGDGINDFWNIKELADFPQCLVSVYSRYGGLVFQSRGYAKPWDGTKNGSPVPTGTYYYIIYPNENNFAPLSGYVAVLR